MQADVSRNHHFAVLHLRAAGAALGVAVLLLAIVRIDVQRELRTGLDSFASSLPTMRMNGNLLQRAAFSGS